MEGKLIARVVFAKTFRTGRRRFPFPRRFRKCQRASSIRCSPLRCAHVDTEPRLSYHTIRRECNRPDSRSVMPRNRNWSEQRGKTSVFWQRPDGQTAKNKEKIRTPVRHGLSSIVLPFRTHVPINMRTDCCPWDGRMATNPTLSRTVRPNVAGPNEKRHKPFSKRRRR